MPDRILITDDEPDILDLARMVLENAAFQVTTATNDEEALLKVEAEMPDLILLDLVMPGKSGLEICNILKNKTRTKHIPIIMFTALGRDVDRKLGADAGADGHFTKPFTSNTLIAEIQKHLIKARGEKFSKQLGIDHGRLVGKKVLLEFDPSTPYTRLVRDFALECTNHNEAVIVLTKRGSAVRQAVEGEKDVELIEVAPDLMFSFILQKHEEQPLSLVYDNLTDLALSTNPQTAYKFASNATERLSDPKITALFLLNPAAHDSKDVYSLKGLFSSQATIGREGIGNIRIT